MLSDLVEEASEESFPASDPPAWNPLHIGPPMVNKADPPRSIKNGGTAMAILHAEPGQVVDVRPLGTALKTTETHTLVKAHDFELIRLIVPAGKEIPTHKAKGEVVVQCLEGKVAFSVFGNTHELEAGRLLYLPTGELHTVRGIEDASLLVYILLPRH